MEVHIDKVFPKYWMIMNQIELRRRGVPAAPWICNWYCYLCLKKGNKNIINNYSIFFKSRGDKRTKSLLDKEISWRILKHYDLGKILSFLTADIPTAWVLYPIWSCVEVFSETLNIRWWCWSIWKSHITATSLYLVMIFYLAIPRNFTLFCSRLNLLFVQISIDVSLIELKIHSI